MLARAFPLEGEQLPAFPAASGASEERSWGSHPREVAGQGSDSQCPPILPCLWPWGTTALEGQGQVEEALISKRRKDERFER